MEYLLPVKYFAGKKPIDKKAFFLKAILKKIEVYC